jgi:hypothetical protein
MRASTETATRTDGARCRRAVGRDRGSLGVNRRARSPGPADQHGACARRSAHALLDHVARTAPRTFGSTASRPHTSSMERRNRSTPGRTGESARCRRRVAGRPCCVGQLGDALLIGTRWICEEVTDPAGLEAVRARGASGLRQRSRVPLPTSVRILLKTPSGDDGRLSAPLIAATCPRAVRSSVPFGSRQAPTPLVGRNSRSPVA